MLPFERREKIIDELHNGTVYITSLSKKLKVSEITVRRDLKNLEEEGLITMLHGGAARFVDTSRETSMDQRERLFPDNKMTIGSFAASLVNYGDVIFIDSGTTNKNIIKHLVNKNVKIVTNGYRNIEEALKYNLDISLVGGDLKRETLAFIGPTAISVLDKYYFDKCFLGVNGIDLEFGLSNADPYESHIKELAIKRSRKAYILSDSSKFNSISSFKFADIKDAIIITEKIVKEFKDLDNVIVASQNDE